MNRILFVALTSGATAISDGFSDIFRATKNIETCYFFATKFAIGEEHPRYFDVTYSRSWRSMSKALNIFLSFREYVSRNEITDVFFYSTLPINGLLSRVLPSKVRVHWWLHDPHTHQGERVLFRWAKAVDDFLMRRNKRLVQVFVASRFLEGEAVAVGISKSLLTVIPFPYLDALVNTKGEQGEATRTANANALRQVLFFGRIEAYKGLPWMLNALQTHGLDLKDKICIKLVGKGNLEFDSRAFVADGFSLEFENSYVANARLRAEILRTDLVVFPYRQATATQAIQSAGALGARVLTTDVGSLPEAALTQHSCVVSSEDACAFVDAIRIEAESSPYDRKKIASDYRLVFAPERWASAIVNAIADRNT